MRVRRERMQKYYFEQTCRAIEAENARAEMDRASKDVVPAPIQGEADDALDSRDPIQMARAANAALKGAA